MSTGWRTLTRNDLRAFDDVQTKAVLYAMDNGGVGRISSNGHCIIRNQQGQTMSVSRSSAGRTKQNTAADLCRLFGAPMDEPKPVKVEPRSITTAPSAKPADDKPVDCPANGCGYIGATQGAVYSHIEKAGHHRCTEAGCNFVSRAPQGIVAHRRIVHEGYAPKRGWRKHKAPTPPQPKRTVETTPDIATVVHEEAEHYDAVHVVERIRDLIGDDPRVAQLQERVAQQQKTIDALVKERDDALAQLSLVREAVHLSA